MGIWKDQSTSQKAEGTPRSAPAATSAADQQASQAPRHSGAESLIASDISIEGKIEGAGHVRIAGRFTGDIDVKGDLTIDAGAKVNGGVRAGNVIIAGELDGNVQATERVELRDGGVLLGDVQAGSLVVTAGSRMRGQVEFGWQDSKPVGKPQVRAGATAAA
jgi:cytoskeletal protein CcmA (bactofilin family)